jgi:hypothetical protein
VLQSESFNSKSGGVGKIWTSAANPEMDFDTHGFKGMGFIMETCRINLINEDEFPNSSNREIILATHMLGSERLRSLW